MKRRSLVFFMLITAFSAVYSQRIPVIGIIPIEATGSGVSAADAANFTRQINAELSSWGTINIVQGSAGAEYVIRGTISRLGNTYTLAASTINAGNERVLNEYNEQASTLNGISIFSFCAKSVERVPLPNYLLGTWQSTINMPDGPVVCIIEFKSDRTVRVERYDTWEHKGNNSLRYEGYGTGSYSYAGYANRTINVSSRQVRIDAMSAINLTLEETLPEQTAVNLTSLGLVFNGDKTTFEIVNNTLPCGRNFDGPSVYPSATIGFSQFTKIR